MPHRDQAVIVHAKCKALPVGPHGSSHLVGVAGHWPRRQHVTVRVDHTLDARPGELQQSHLRDLAAVCSLPVASDGQGAAIYSEFGDVFRMSRSSTDNPSTAGLGASRTHQYRAGHVVARATPCAADGLLPMRDGATRSCCRSLQCRSGYRSSARELLPWARSFLWRNETPPTSPREVAAFVYIPVSVTVA